jgi:hypothetical protein
MHGNIVILAPGNAKRLMLKVLAKPNLSYAHSSFSLSVDAMAKRIQTRVMQQEQGFQLIIPANAGSSHKRLSILILFYKAHLTLGYDQ